MFYFLDEWFNQITGDDERGCRKCSWSTSCRWTGAVLMTSLREFHWLPLTAHFIFLCVRLPLRWTFYQITRFHFVSLSLSSTLWFFLFSSLVFNNVSVQAAQVMPFIMSLCLIAAINPVALLSLSPFLSLLYSTCVRLYMCSWLNCVWLGGKRLHEKLLRPAICSFFFLHWRQWHLKGGSTYRKLTPTAITYLRVPTHWGNYTEFGLIRPDLKRISSILHWCCQRAFPDINALSDYSSVKGFPLQKCRNTLQVI